MFRFDKTCSHCEQEYTPNRMHQQYCTASCKQLAYFKRKGKFRKINSSKKAQEEYIHQQARSIVFKEMIPESLKESGRFLDYHPFDIRKDNFPSWSDTQWICFEYCNEHILDFVKRLMCNIYTDRAIGIEYIIAIHTDINHFMKGFHMQLLPIEHPYIILIKEFNIKLKTIIDNAKEMEQDFVPFKLNDETKKVFQLIQYQFTKAI